MKPAIVVLMSVALLTACGSPDITATTTSVAPASTQPDPGDSPTDELEAARQRWEAAGLDTYRFEFEDDCGECDPVSRLPRTVVVWDGEATTSIQPTVDELFATVESAIEEDRSVDVVYHPALGHPTEISIDMEARVYDGGTHWLVRDLEPGLPGDEVSLAALESARDRWESSRPPAYEFRTDIGCDCPLAGSIWAYVEGNRVADWAVEFSDSEDAQISPITVDTMFDDLAEMLASSQGVVDEGVRFTGSASYHPEMGYPVWIGLEIEILDPDSELADLPSRLIFSIRDLTPVEATEEDPSNSDLRDARERWEGSGLTDYTYELTIHDVVAADFSDPYVVTVIAGEVVSIEHQGQPIDDAEAPILTIDGFFDHVEEWRTDGGTVDALFHEQLGYPVLLVFGGADILDVDLVISIDDLKTMNDTGG